MILSQPILHKHIVNHETWIASRHRTGVRLEWHDVIDSAAIFNHNVSYCDISASTIRDIQLTHILGEKMIAPGIIVSGINAKDSWFNYSELPDSIFVNGVFSDCRFECCDLSRCVFIGCRFTRCIFRYSEVAGAEFKNCQFVNCNFNKVALKDIKFKNSRIAKCWGVRK